MPKIEKISLNGYLYLTDAKAEPVKEDLVYCTDVFNNPFIVRVLGNNGMYISYKLHDNRVKYTLDAKKIVASSDIRLGLPAIKEEMLPYVPLVELAQKMWAAQKQREFDIVCTYDILGDFITIHADDYKSISFSMIITKAKEKFMLTQINIENGKKK